MRALLRSTRHACLCYATGSRRARCNTLGSVSDPHVRCRHSVRAYASLMIRLSDWSGLATSGLARVPWVSRLEGCTGGRHRADGRIHAKLGGYAELDELLATATIVSLHCRPVRRHLIGTSELARMQPTAFLINTSRGDLIDEAALPEAIVGGRRLPRVGPDVVSEVNPFAYLPQIIVTPHWATVGQPACRGR
jgi:hypothetical protein